MTEAEWLTSTDPQRMLEYITADRPWRTGSYSVSDRKLRLFACACCRQVWNNLSDDRSRHAVETAERYEDGSRNSIDLRDARSAAMLMERSSFYSGDFDAELAYKCAGPIQELISNSGLPRWFSVSTKLAPQQAALLREIIGNPFRKQRLCEQQTGDSDTNCWKCRSVMTPTVLSIAQTVYDERAFDRMPVLGDALEDSGCDNQDVLRHCRGEEQCRHDGVIPAPGGHMWDYCPHCTGQCWRPLRGPHVRGCFVLDLLLGKS
jgi:hypothetical protein